MSWPGFSSSDAPSSRAGALTRGSSAAADATTTRAVPRGERVQRPRARRRHADVRRQPAIRIDFVRRDTAGPRARPRRRTALRAREEEGDVRARLLEIAVLRHDVQHDAVRTRLRGAGDEQRLRGRRQTRHDARRHVHPAAGDGGLENGAEVE